MIRASCLAAARPVLAQKMIKSDCCVGALVASIKITADWLKAVPVMRCGAELVKASLMRLGAIAHIACPAIIRIDQSKILHNLIARCFGNE